MPKIGKKEPAVFHLGQKLPESQTVRIGQKMTPKKSNAKSAVLDPEFMEGLKKIKL